MKLRKSKAIDFTIRGLIFFVFVFVVNASNSEELPVIKDNALSSNPGNVNPPVNPHDLWSRIITLLKIRDGSVNNDELENILGVRMVSADKASQQNGNENLKYWGSEDLPELDKVVAKYFIQENPTRIMWGVSWGGTFYDTYSCVNIFQATADLAVLGWYPAPRSGLGFNIAFYKKIDWENYRKSGSVNGVDRKLPIMTIVFGKQFSECMSGISVIN